jgi:hypothetical protein
MKIVDSAAANTIGRCGGAPVAALRSSEGEAGIV